jgi:ankyrin repeat protein
LSFVAAGEGHDKIVEILCEAGADVNIEDVSENAIV